MFISVIIPTFNRANTLKECLVALCEQDFPLESFEVIVVDDGSKDETRDVADKFKTRLPNLKYVHQSNRGQGIARNLGVKKAIGDIIVFIGDDILVKEDFLTEHLRYHLRFIDENDAVLGFTTWHPKLTITPFMKWLENGSCILGKYGGHQFAYEKLKDKEMADYNFFYTSNISLNRSLLEKYPFDPGLSGYGWEDIELGYRLHNRVDLKIHYNPGAIGFHNHAMTEESLKARMRSIGLYARIINKKYPELKKVPDWKKRIIFSLLSNKLTLSLLGLIRNISQGTYCNLYFFALSKKYFMEGINQKTTNF